VRGGPVGHFKIYLKIYFGDRWNKESGRWNKETAGWNKETEDQHFL
jgi:hypothetical protein